MLWLSVSDALLVSCGVCERGGLGSDENGKQSITLTFFPQGGDVRDGASRQHLQRPFYPAPGPDWSSTFAAKLDRCPLASPGEDMG